MQTTLIILSYILIAIISYLTCYFGMYRKYKTAVFLNSIKEEIIRREGDLNNIYWLNMPDFDSIVFSFKPIYIENFLSKELIKYFNSKSEKKVFSKNNKKKKKRK